MNEILMIDEKVDIGIKFRNKTQGPELDLVYNFIDNITNQFKHKENKLAIFVEPLVDTTYPDIVLLEYVDNNIEKWNKERNNLSRDDIKLLTIIKQFESISSTSLHNRTKINYRNILNSLEKLIDSDLINRKNEKWTINPLEDIFFIKKISAVEAKVNQLDNLLHQADINNWFASESYALSSVKKPHNKTIEKFKNYGIGLYSLNDNKIKKFTKAKKQRIPNNYASWMFNEWLGRYITQR
ncbi:MAG: hypothetical protein WBF48_10760 [Halarcobacter sp.]